MVGRPAPGQARTVAIVLLVAAITTGVVIRQRPTRTATNTTNQNPARLTYAEYYEAAWRQDQGLGNMTITATLITPPMLTALAADTQRSERDDQILFQAKNLTAEQIGFVVTVDSVAGYVADQAMLESGAVSDSRNQPWTVASWKPIIGVQPTVNASVTVVSQAGILIATAPDPINWTTLKNLKLVLSGIGDQSVRQFVWAEPSLLAGEAE